MIYFTCLLMVIVNALFYVSRVPYTCQPYNPPQECESGLYKISLYEQPTDRHPIAQAESHCVISLPGRVKAETVRFTVFNKWTREISEVEYFSEQEFPAQNLEVCSWR